MNEETLRHYGVKGMKWGIRRTPKQLGHKVEKTKKETKKEIMDKKTSMTDQKKNIEKKSVRETKKEPMDKKTSMTDQKKNIEKKSVREMSDSELKDLISRLELEKKYKDLMASPPSEKETSKGKKFVMDILESSGKNIGGQLTTYLMGTAVNKVFASVFNDDKIVNPKKGQKDK